MKKALDPRFGKTIRLMRSTQHEGERAAARSRAEAIAAGCGMTFAEALAVFDRPEPAPRPANIFDGFDDWMEEKEPGWKAQKAREKAERIAAWAIRKAAILARYGSMEAAVAPCWRERLILTAVAPWRKLYPNANRPDGWTVSLDGYRHFPHPLPEHVREAVCQAYPLPDSFAEAKAEHDYWCARNDELEDIFSQDGRFDGNHALDLAAQVRADILRELVKTDLPTTTLTDLHARFKMLVDGDSHDTKMEKALFRDLTVMVERERQASIAVDTSIGTPATVHPLHGQIEDVLKADPAQTDRHIARRFGCSPTTVGKARRRLGLAETVRSVRRGGQVYSMKRPADAASGGSAR